MRSIYELINCYGAGGLVTEVWDSVSYGPALATSRCVWMIPGTYEEYE